MTWRRVVFPLGHVGPSRRSVDMGTTPIHPTSAQTSERDQCDARFTILRPRPFIRDFRCRAEHLVRIDEHEFVLKNLICDYYVECY